MPQKTSIQWCTHTSNVVKFRDLASGKIGWHCVKCSPGCANCYSERFDFRLGLGHGFTARASAMVEPVLMEKELAGLRKLKAPAMVFLEDMSDLFLEAIPDAMIDQVFEVIADRPTIVFQVLTKRIRRATEYVTRNGEFPNLWLGTSVENRWAFDTRVPHLKSTKPAVRFLSVEPQIQDLGIVDLTGIDWVIQGGESGSKARPFDIAWARSLRDQCKAAGVPFFLKQLGACPYDSFYRSGEADQRIYLKDSHGGDPKEWPLGLRNCREFPAVASHQPALFGGAES